MSQSDGASDFATLLSLVRAGDPHAAAQLVARYEPEIRRAVRVRMTDPRLRRVVDSLDVCQSVLANFFVRVSLGEFDLNRPEDLVALLVAMVRNKLVDQTRRLQAQRRDQRRVQAGGDSAIDRLPTAGPAPDQIAASRELLDEVRRRLTADELYLAEQRALGRPWPELATELGAQADALRKKLSRALSRVAGELGLEDVRDE